MARSTRALLLAIGFLTRLPSPAVREPQSAEFGLAVAFYPAVGLLIGLLLGSVAMAGSALWLAGLITAALVVAGWVAVTGALHLDGVADTADGWLGGQGDREKTLAIMGDSRSGAAAVVAVSTLLLLKFAAVASLIDLGVSLWKPLLAATVAGRMALTALLLTTRYARSTGLGSVFSDQLPRGIAWLSVAVSGVFLLVLCGWLGAGVLLLAAGGVFVFWRGWMCRRLGGFTGDTAGAMTELIELTTLLAWAASVA